MPGFGMNHLQSGEGGLRWWCWAQPVLGFAKSPGNCRQTPRLFLPRKDICVHNLQALAEEGLL